MCIIALKFKGADFAPLTAIKACVDNNPHGFAMAWNEGGALKTFRTMDPEEAIARYYTLSTTLDPMETSMVFHARIATHGSKRLENCHCWTYRDKLAFAHNGVMHNVKPMTDKTDSETFFRKLLMPAVEKLGWEYADLLADAVAGDSNRLAIIDCSGAVWTHGDYIKEQFPGLRGKIYFSNRSYMPRFDYGPAGKKDAVPAGSLSLGKRSRPAARGSAVTPPAARKGRGEDLLAGLFANRGDDRLPF